MASIQRAIAGSEAPIRIVGGSRQMAQITARNISDARPWTVHGRVNGIDQRDHQQFENAAEGDANLNARVGPQRVHRVLAR